MMMIKVWMSEVISYQFTFDAEIPKDTPEDQVNSVIGELADDYFTANGPKDEWVMGVNERDIDGWEPAA